MARTIGAERGLSRFEGFTDGVFGIALTLLITEIKPPGAPQGRLPRFRARRKSTHLIASPNPSASKVTL